MSVLQVLLVIEMVGTFAFAVSGALLAAKKGFDVVGSLLLAGLASAQNVAFTDVNVFDGEQLLPASTVMVENGLITAVGQDAAIPEGMEVIDGKITLSDLPGIGLIKL